MPVSAFSSLIEVLDDSTLGDWLTDIWITSMVWVISSVLGPGLLPEGRLTATALALDSLVAFATLEIF